MLLSIFGLFVPLAILADAALRDQRTKMDEMIRAAPVATGTYLLGRFAGAFIVTVVVFCGAFVGMVVGTKMWWIDPAVVGSLSVRRLPERAGDHRTAESVFRRRVVLPAASVTRSMLATYVVAHRASGRSFRHLDDRAIRRCAGSRA